MVPADRSPRRQRTFRTRWAAWTLRTWLLLVGAISLSVLIVALWSIFAFTPALLLIGYVLGAGQQPLLRQVWPAHKGWIPATIVGSAGGMIVGLSVNWFLRRTDLFQLIIWTAIGVCLGGTQAMTFRNYALPRQWWVIAGLLGGAAFGACAQGSATLRPGAGIGNALLVIAVGSALYAAITGLAFAYLARFTRKRSLKRSKPATPADDPWRDIDVRR